MTPLMSPVVQDILSEVDRLGIQMHPSDDVSDRLRFRPRAAMPTELAKRITDNKPALLAWFRNKNLSDKTPVPQTPNRPESPSEGVLSVLSVSEPSRAMWCESELAMLAREGVDPSDLPMVSALKDVFADWDVAVVSIESTHGHGKWTRRRAGQLLRLVRQTDPLEAHDLWDTWRERIAICMIDGDLPLENAEEMALEELETVLHLRGSPR